MAEQTLRDWIGKAALFSCKMLNIDGSHFDVLVNKLLEYIFKKVQTWGKELYAGVFQSLQQPGGYEMAMSSYVLL